MTASERDDVIHIWSRENDICVTGCSWLSKCDTTSPVWILIINTVPVANPISISLSFKTENLSTVQDPTLGKPQNLKTEKSMINIEPLESPVASTCPVLL